MIIDSINPYNGVKLSTHVFHTEKEMEMVLNQSENAFQGWRKLSITERSQIILRVADILKSKTEYYATMITQEMGKPIMEAISEVKKCAWVCEYYAENSNQFLTDEVIETEASQSFVQFAPLGCILGIMPWNFPFWQVFRFAVPTLAAGNVVLLKHAPNVLGSAKMIEKIFLEAGIPHGVFQNIIIPNEVTENLLQNDMVQGVSLTGGEQAGASVAALAGKYIKKSVLELGGSNSFIVCNDANLEDAIETAIAARYLNNGQSCIAAKRFLIESGIHDEFVEKLVGKVSLLKSGDPMDRGTQIGVMARLDLAENLQLQIRQSEALGAKCVYGGSQSKCYHEPTVLIDAKPGMPIFDEETFGPVAAICMVDSLQKALEISKQTKYGLGVSVFTHNVEKALSFATEVIDGAYFVNEMVKSDPRLPFGGTKKSGFGRELARDGILEFVNKKTIYVK